MKMIVMSGDPEINNSEDSQKQVINVSEVLWFWLYHQLKREVGGREVWNNFIVMMLPPI